MHVFPEVATFILVSLVDYCEVVLNTQQSIDLFISCGVGTFIFSLVVCYSWYGSEVIHSYICILRFLLDPSLWYFLQQSAYMYMQYIFNHRVQT